MKIYLYNKDYSEQSNRQMQTIIPYLSRYKIYSDDKWEDLLKNMYEIKNLGLERFLTHEGEKGIIFFTIMDGHKLLRYKKKYNNILYIFRPRGLLPEESYYKHGSRLRKKVLNYIERKAIRTTDYFIFLQDMQRVHFLSKYQEFTEKFENYSILPNISTVEVDNYSLKDMKQTISLLYSGGFSEWQNIDYVFKLVSDIIKGNNTTESGITIKFKILTFEHNFDIVRHYIHKYSIENDTDFEYVKPNQMSNELIKHDIGIIIRDSNVVNVAASPFKIMDYVSHGLGLIITNNNQNHVSGLLNEDNYYALRFANGKLDYDVNELTKFIKRFNGINRKLDILKNYKRYLSRVKPINID